MRSIMRYKKTQLRSWDHKLLLQSMAHRVWSRIWLRHKEKWRLKLNLCSKKLRDRSKSIHLVDFSQQMTQWFSRHKTDLKVVQTTTIIFHLQTWRSKRLSVTGSNSKIDCYKKNAEMRSSISPWRIGLKPKNAFRERSIGRMRTGIRQLNSRRQEVSSAETGPHQILTRKTILLKRKHHQVAAKVKRY
jgi:hypothetical protein